MVHPIGIHLQSQQWFLLNRHQNVTRQSNLWAKSCQLPAASIFAAVQTNKVAPIATQFFRINAKMRKKLLVYHNVCKCQLISSMIRPFVMSSTQIYIKQSCHWFSPVCF
ncbi:hypothetical protein AMECASPLE_035847 [Ameca splendens]|uniref:Uncharacterized protein n=1 Tax=Ameca splendens TaxID=208324 RepID=A0ABV1AFM3_9TELE